MIRNRAKSGDVCEGEKVLGCAPVDLAALARAADAVGWRWILTVHAPDGIAVLCWERGRLAAAGDECL